MKNYYQLQQKEIAFVKNLPKKPTLLLHTCCALCFSSAFLQIKDDFEISVFFFNPNIYPLEEYEKRKNELLRIIHLYEKEWNISIPFIEKKEDFHLYQKVKTHRNACYDCLHYRLLESYIYASTHQFDYLTTTLTVGRLKDSYFINSIGETLQKQFPNTKYFLSDFKKNKGIDLSLEMKAKYQIYAQNYCGCEHYSCK